MIDFVALNEALIGRARELLPQWFPNGRFQGSHEFVVGNIQGDEGDSLCIDLRSGKWIDFASPEDKGGDFISIYAAHFQVDQRTAAITLGAIDKLNGHAGGPSIARALKSAPSNRPAPQICPQEPYEPAVFRHPVMGLPVQFWTYHDRQARPIFVIARYETVTGKKFCQWTTRNGAWARESYTKPRPLYNLHNLPPSQAPVLLVEGERTCDAAQLLFPELIAMTWAGGANAVSTVDWTPLQGRNVTIWPDNDEPGRQAATRIGEILVRNKATVSIVDPSGWPEAWDLADALPTDDVVSYAASHVVTVTLNDVKPQPPPKVEVLQKAPKPGAIVIEGPTLPGSLQGIWQRYHFSLRGNGIPFCNHYNVTRALQVKNDLISELDLYYDEFSNKVMVNDRVWTDDMTTELTIWLQRDMEMADVKIHVVDAAVRAYAKKHRRHPIREWMNQLEWNNVPLLRDLIPIGFGAERNEYTESVGRCFIVGMVARIMQPGCQVDAMPVFEGAQGAGKTKALRVIGGAYFAEIHDSIMSKDFMGSLTGKMLCEISELGAFRAADVDRIKGIISNNVDDFRAPYARFNENHPRQNVFSATTNRDDWNTDETGARRFWPVRCRDIDIGWIERHREQLFAEAVFRYKAGEPWWNVPSDKANEEREARWDADPWDDVIAPYIKYRETVRISDIMANQLEMSVDRMDIASQRRIGRILRKAGFEKVNRRIGDDVIKQWERKRRD